MQSERSLIDLQKDFEKLPIPYAQFTKRMVWLDRKNDEIMDRINLRTQSMIDGGMIEEAEQAIRLVSCVTQVFPVGGVPRNY